MFFLHTPQKHIFLKSYLVALVSFLIIDAVYLLYIANAFYNEQLGALLADEVRFSFALLFYAVYPIGVVLLAVLPSLGEKAPFSGALFRGAVLGFISYGTYGFTNAAVLRDWPIPITYVDTTWGALITAVVAFLTVLFLKYRT